jgi:hypothetical protein
MATNAPACSAWWYHKPRKERLTMPDCSDSILSYSMSVPLRQLATDHLMMHIVIQYASPHHLLHSSHGDYTFFHAFRLALGMAPDVYGKSSHLIPARDSSLRYSSQFLRDFSM